MLKHWHVLKFKSFYVQNERCYVINYFILPCKHLIYFTCISGYIAAYGMFILENLIVNCKLNQNKVYIRVTWPSVHSCGRKKGPGSLYIHAIGKKTVIVTGETSPVAQRHIVFRSLFLLQS